MTPVRILHVLNTPRAEGTPNLVLDWLAAGEGCWQAVLCLNADPPDLTDRLRANAAAYEEHRLFRPGLGKYPGMVRAVSAAVRKHRPDVVVCWTTGFGNWVSLGARVAGCRRLIVHAGNPAVSYTRRDRWLTRYTAWPLVALRAKVVCCSHYVRDTYQSVPVVGRSLFTTIYNCTRAEEVARRGANETRGRCGGIMVATLEAHKDHATLLRAMPAILNRRPDFRLRLVGAGVLAGRLRELSAVLGVADRVEFLGSRRDVPELLGRAQLFVFATTVQEGLGSVLLEALAARLPVVASDVPACRELLAGGRWGRLVPPADPAALADAVCDALARPPAENELTKAAAYAAGFTPGRMITQYLAAVGLRCTGGCNERL